MSKCKICGRHGFFHKLNKDGICHKCISHVQADYAALQAESASLHSDILLATARRDELVLKNEAAQKSLDTATARTEKLQFLAKSIKSANDAWIQGGTAEAAARTIATLPLKDLLPQLDLNCLTMKQLKARYTSIRKQILELCAAYEERYTNKVNAIVYKLIVLLLESELDNILHKLQFGKLENAISDIRQLTSKCYALATDGNQNIAPTLKRFIGQIESLYLDVIAVEYEYYVQRERAKEEQRALKEQMRQEAEDRKRLDLERKKVEREESKYQLELERLTQMISSAKDAELESLRTRLAEVTSQLNTVEERKFEVINLQNGKAGTVYIISNVGAFGDHVFKIGMTRRMEAQDRVDELGSASVPFPFDVHSFIFSNDAVALETALHHELNDRRVNKVNLRKEFFDIRIEELQPIIERIDPTAPFRTTALAEQYHQSQSMHSVPDSPFIQSDDDEDIA